MKSRLLDAHAQIKSQKPIVLCLTNTVTMDFMANCLLALGAAPIMSCDDAEFEELINISHAVNINIGTLDTAFITRCETAIDLCKQFQKPIILDPVGAGASNIRTKAARQFMRHADIIRGNASEIMALIDDGVSTAGVESSQTTNVAKTSALELAAQLNTTVVVSGAEDYITDGKRNVSLLYGSSLMPYVTGMGCALTAVTAAFRAVICDSFEAAQLATAYFGMCGELAASETQLPGSFRTAFIDALYRHEIISKTML
jgi:hydroxyethylthiazole kinase